MMSFQATRFVAVCHSSSRGLIRVLINHLSRFENFYCTWTCLFRTAKL